MGGKFKLKITKGIFPGHRIVKPHDHELSDSSTQILIFCVSRIANLEIDVNDHSELQNYSPQLSARPDSEAISTVHFPEDFPPKKVM
jgi:hypothetical protein